MQRRRPGGVSAPRSATHACPPPLVQGAVQHVCFGKPKATNVDEWDRLVARRDERILEEWRQKQG